MPTLQVTQADIANPSTFLKTPLMSISCRIPKRGQAFHASNSPPRLYLVHSLSTRSVSSPSLRPQIRCCAGRQDQTGKLDEITLHLQIHFDEVRIFKHAQKPSLYRLSSCSSALINSTYENCFLGLIEPVQVAMATAHQDRALGHLQAKFRVQKLVSLTYLPSSSASKSCSLDLPVIHRWNGKSPFAAQ